MSNAVPKLLVSVRSSEEALDAVEGGADWIDLKEPLAGPLGAVSVDVAREAVATLGGEAPLSAALGELVDWQSNSKDLWAIEGIGVVKLGLAKCNRIDWQQQWLEVFAEIEASSKQLAGVIYADWHEVEAPAPQDVLECVMQAGSEYLLIDTWNKSRPSTLQLLPIKNLSRILLEARNSGIKTVLAGKISPNDLPLIASLSVDIVAVRGAVCTAGRESRLKAGLVKQFHDLLHCSAAKCDTTTAH